MPQRTSSVEDDRSIRQVGPQSTWTTVLPVAFIIVSLLSLLLMPIIVGRQTRRLRDEISRVAEPARRSANTIQVTLSAELDKIIAYQVTGEQQYRDAYLALLRQQNEERSVLRRLAPRLDPSLDGDLDALFAQTERWHSGVADGELVARQMPQEIFLTRLYERHPAYEKSLLAASDLEMQLQTGIEERLSSIHSAERLSVSFTIILTLLALTSAMLVAGLGRRMRLLAREAMRRRQDAEREAQEAMRARGAAEREERRAAFIAAAGRELVSSLDVEQTVSTLSRLIVPNLAGAAVVDIVEGEETLRRAAAVHRDPEISKAMRAFVGERLESVPDVLTRILQAREVRLIGSTPSMSTYAGGDGTLASTPTMIVPLVSRGQNLGVIVAFAPDKKPFTHEDMPLFTELARHASLAIDNARLYRDSLQAVRAREEVLAIVSHDLRNPLNAVMLASSLLESSESIADEDREPIDTISVSAKRMSRLIADLLDVTRLEGGKRLPIEPERLDLRSLFDEMYELFKAQAAAASVTLESEVDDALPPVYADRHRMIQVLSNLVGNSLKFTPTGGLISFRAGFGRGEVLVQVSDTGPGIPSEHLSDIFSPYWQAKRTERLGAGLGLPIAKGIVESHGGRIWVVSDAGSGTTFYFTVPLAQEGQTAAAAR